MQFSSFHPTEDASERMVRGSHSFSLSQIRLKMFIRAVMVLSTNLLWYYINPLYSVNPFVVATFRLHRPFNRPKKRENMAEFKPIKQTRASEEVLEQIKDSILRGRFKAGDKLPSERELTEQFQVSRGVVREAIRVLEKTGFVSIRQGPSGGAYVTDLNFDHLSSGFLDLYLANKLTIPELNQVRMHIEPEVARLAAQRVTPAFRVRLEKAVSAEREPVKSYVVRMERLTSVHYILAEMCGNYLFEAIVNSFIRLTHQIVEVVEPEDHNALHAVGEHDAVVAAVLAGDPDKAAKAMTDHLKVFCEGLIKMDKTYRGLRRY